MACVNHQLDLALRVEENRTLLQVGHKKVFTLINWKINLNLSKPETFFQVKIQAEHSKARRLNSKDQNLLGKTKIK